MQSAVLFTIISGLVLVNAAPAMTEERSEVCASTGAGAGAYYVCYNSGFKGYCSSDPCDKAWCPDFEQDTCTPKAPSPWTPTTTPPVVPTPTPVQSECQGSGNYYVCGNNGFRGYCSSDPCNMAWCPDFAYKSCDRIVRTVSSPVESPKVSDPPTTWKPKAYYRCSVNQFDGYCSVDPCAMSWCPDYQPKTYNSVAVAAADKRDETVCPAGTGYFQSCSNGFRGCCKTDACGASWCAQYKPGTYELVSSGFTTSSRVTIPTPTPWTGTDSTTCAQGQGYFQSCASGFRGCCKQDACSKGYCPAE